MTECGCITPVESEDSRRSYKATLSDITYQIRRGRKRPSVVHMDQLCRYHESGRYSWGHGEEEEGVSHSSSDEDVAEADQDVDEHLGGAGDVADASGDPQPELGAGDAPLGATSCLPPPTPSLQRPQREQRRPGWMRDFCDVPED